MWKRPAGPASSKELCEGWDSPTFHALQGSGISTVLFSPQPLQWRAGYLSGFSSSLAINFQPMASVKRGPAPPFELGFQEPMECLLVSTLPEGPEWTYEIKLDGYRAQALHDGEQTRLLSRNGKDLGQRFPALLSELAKAVPHGSIVDGELVALDPTGRPSFSLIQNCATSGATFVFFAFDLLRLDGADLTRRPLSERRALLQTSLRHGPALRELQHSRQANA